MNKNLYILSTFSILFILAWCESKIENSPQEIVVQEDITTKPIKVTDAQILKELEFMKIKWMITSDTYEKAIRMSVMPRIWKNSDGTVSEIYPSCFENSCDWVYARESIQNMMKENNI